jgi:8-oxo-dGTP pyrophosphatase MutT (NUDIX family)
MTLAERLRQALGASKHSSDLVGDDFDFAADILLTEAAVLVAVIDRPEPTVLLTRRNETMRKHAGQIAFPGGRIDPEDASVEAAALREAYEEVALPPASVELVGIGDRYVTGTRFSITPVIGVIPPGLPLTPHEAEVAELFEVPLARVLDPKMHVEQQAEFGGRTRRFYEITVDGRRIWGATAGIIVNLAARLAPR